MINFKEYLRLLIESVWDDVLDTWSQDNPKDEVDNTIKTFRNLVNKNQIPNEHKNIQQWGKKPYKEFKDFVTSVETKYNNTRSIKVKKQNLPKEDAEIVFENNNLVIYQIKSKKAACSLGSDTDWCITKEKHGYFYDYTDKGYRFYFAMSSISKYPNDKITIKYDSNSKNNFYSMINRLNEDKDGGILNREQKIKWLKENNITEDKFKSIIKDFKVVEVEKNLVEFNYPEYYKGDINAASNKLVSLKGSPTKVEGHFSCENNNLVSLKGAPTVVNGDFVCSINKLTSLDGSPKEVGRDFYCFDNKLTSLKGAPKEIGRDFLCSDNQLTSLEGAPKEIGRDFVCSDNQLTSLKGAPKEVGGDFVCVINNLTSLEGAPKEIGRDFLCYDNKLTSLEGAPKEVGGNFSCMGNTKKFTEEEVRAVCNVKGNVFV